MADSLPQKIEVVKHSPYVYSTMFYCKNSHDLLNTHTFHDVILIYLVVLKSLFLHIKYTGNIQ